MATMAHMGQYALCPLESRAMAGPGPAYACGPFASAVAHYTVLYQTAPKGRTAAARLRLAANTPLSRVGEIA